MAGIYQGRIFRRLLAFWGLIFAVLIVATNGFSSGFNSRAFLSSPRSDDRPKLILIGGCSGTGKSTFGMTVALDQGILKCISTDTLRSVMRSFISPSVSPALHRSSYEVEQEGDDPIRNWKESCNVLRHSVDDLVEEMIDRGVSLVVEGVHLIPDTELIQKWEENGGVALGIMLTVSNEDAHRNLLLKRGSMTGKGEEDKLEQFHRIRSIHDEMVRMAKEANWMLVEQNLAPDPLDMVIDGLYNKPGRDGFSNLFQNDFLTDGIEQQHDDDATNGVKPKKAAKNFST